MKNMFYALFMAICFFSCSESDDCEYMKMYYRLIKPYRKGIEKKYNLQSAGGGGGFINTINKVYLAFTSVDAISIDICRKEYVDMVTELLSVFNNNEEIRPHLLNYPFTAKNVDILIMYNSNPNLVIPDRVYTVNMYEGTIKFHMADLDSRSPETCIRETFEDAYFKVYGKNWEP